MVTQNKIFNLVLFTTTLLIILVSLECVVGHQSSSNIRCFENERQALLKFRDDLVDEYGRISSWGVGDNKRECCKWRGIHCHNQSNHVIQLNLSGDEGYHYSPIRMAPLKGKISPYLLELKHLTYLDLSYNDFGYSNIPEFIGSFEKLQYLNLSNATLSKSIPRNVGNLSELQYLDFSGNDVLYSDNLDWVSNLGSLKYLDLSYIGLHKVSNWLQAISKLSYLKELHLANCGVQDIHPSSLPSTNASAPLAILDLSLNPSISPRTFQWFLNFSKSLTFIDLSDNNIASHMIPAYAFDKQIFLAHLDLSSNNLEDGIPKSFGNMSSLIYLNLQSNHIAAQLSELTMNLSGPLEKKLEYLDLSDNKISGSLPNFSRFSFLNRLDLGKNKLNGSIAKGFLDIPYLSYLDLSANKFTGTLPDLTIYPFLRRLYLNNNMFHGYLSESIGNMSKMEDLVLHSNNLEGIVTGSHFSSLSSLKILDLSYNSLLTLNFSPHWNPPFQLRVINLSQCKIGPRFPQWLQFQRKLKFLDISFSQIVDTIPSWFGDVASKLICLCASDNQIHGVFPEIRFSTSIRRELDLSRNKISGQATFLCQHVGWESIDLSDNLFSKDLPNCFANHTSLIFLNLANNNFSGRIPNSFGSLHLLSLLNLRNNSFSGGIPTFLRNCTQLDMIDFGKNRLTGNIPTWIGNNLSRLIVLSLRFNEFNGTIPWSICNLQNIKVIDLSSNNISGIIPRCLHNLTAMIDKPADLASRSYNFFNLLGTCAIYRRLLEGVYFMWKGKEIIYVNRLKFVELIDLSNNVLVGDIPTEITKLIALAQMNLSRNNLTGFIPQNIGHMKSLDSLDLSRNQLSGGIPISLSELNFLGILNLSYNNLSGRIPPRFFTFDESSYMGNSGLCGRHILNKSCPGEDEINHQSSNFNDEHDDDDDDKFITKGFYICMGVGFFVGFWGIFGTILLNRSARFAYIKWLNTIGDFIYVKVELNKAHLRRRFQN